MNKIKMKITWNDGSKDKFSIFFNEKELENFRKSIFEEFENTVISLGEPPHTYFHLKNARKIEIYE